MKNNCEYYDQMLGTENLDELVNTSINCESEDKTIKNELIVPAEQYSLEKKTAVHKTGLAKELRFKEAYAITTKYAKEAVGIIGQWVFKWAAYPTIGCTNGETKNGIEDLIGKEYFDAEKAGEMNGWANCVTYPLIAFGVYNWDIGPIADYAVPIVSGIACNIVELAIRSRGFEDEDALFKTPTLIGALISPPVKAMTYLAKGFKEGYKKLKPLNEES